jgi:hypothetical protein
LTTDIILALAPLYIAIVGLIAVYFTIPEMQRQSRKVTLSFLLIGLLASALLIWVSFSRAGIVGLVISAIAILVLVFLLWALYQSFASNIEEYPVRIANERLLKLVITHNGGLVDWIVDVIVKQIPYMRIGRTPDKSQDRLTANKVLRPFIDNLLLTLSDTELDPNQVKVSVLQTLPNGKFNRVAINEAFDDTVINNMEKFCWGPETEVKGIAGRCASINAPILCPNIQLEQQDPNCKYWIPTSEADGRVGGIIAVPIPLPAGHNDSIPCLGIISIRYRHPNVLTNYHVEIINQESNIKLLQSILILRKLIGEMGVNES